MIVPYLTEIYFYRLYEIKSMPTFRIDSISYCQELVMTLDKMITDGVVIKQPPYIRRWNYARRYLEEKTFFDIKDCVFDVIFITKK